MLNKKLSSKDYKKILFSIPKTEIHLHLEGMASVDTIWSLIKKHKLEIPGISNREDIIKRFQVKNLDDFIDLFLNIIQNCYREEIDLNLQIKDAREYLIRNNIIYTEVFFAPSKFLMNGFSFDVMMEYLDQGAKKIKKEDNIDIKFLIDVSRSFGPENAINNLNLILKHKKSSIIGIGLGGAESKGPAQDYKEVFELARNAGLKVVAHAGEDVGPESIWSTINDLQVSRIGHGISAIQDTKLMDYLKETQIPLEICPMSNIFTKKYVSSYKDHPIRKFYDYGMYVTVNTDDPTIFGMELIDEYSNLLDNDIFNLEEVFELIKKNLYATFQTTPEKDAMWGKMEKVIKQYR
ncbi:MAG: adenosine deaminase [Spirochaetales bacterium]|nr:adenosine deaminase [Spirochaetales bacterium]